VQTAFVFNGRMSNEHPRPAQPKDKNGDKATVPRQEKAGRSGEGSRSVLPHLKADQRARAVARMADRTERRW
jgi:hypothetical protein